MKIFTLSISIILLLAVTSCGPSEQENSEALKEAGAIFMESIKIEESFKDDLDQLTQKSNSISIQSRVLEPEEIRFVETVNQLKNSYDTWEHDLVDVPGFDRPGHEGHDHGPKVELLPEDMLIVQKELRDSIIAMKGRAESLLKQ